MQVRGVSVSWRILILVASSQRASQRTSFWNANVHVRLQQLAFSYSHIQEGYVILTFCFANRFLHEMQTT